MTDFGRRQARFLPDPGTLPDYPDDTAAPPSRQTARATTGAEPVPASAALDWRMWCPSVQLGARSNGFVVVAPGMPTEHGIVYSESGIWQSLQDPENYSTPVTLASG